MMRGLLSLREHPRLSSVDVSEGQFSSDAIEEIQRHRKKDNFVRVR